MQKLWAIAMTDLRIFMADRSNLVGLLLIPAVFVIVLGFAQGGAPTRNVRVVVLDQDASTLSNTLIRDIADSNDSFEVFTTPNSLEDTRQNVVNGQYDALVVIPAGFSEAVENFQPIALDFYSNEDVTTPSAVQPAIEAVVSRLDGSLVVARVGESVTTAIGAEVDQQALYERAQAIFSQDPVQINFSYSNVDEQTVNGFSQSVPGMGSMFVMFTILGGMAVLVREREQWTLQRLVVMPVSRAQIIGGKILMYFTLGMIQYVVVFAIGLVFGMDFGNSLLGLLLLAMAFSLATTALTFALATRMRTQGQASQLTTLLALSLAALGGAWWPLSVVPETMRIVGHLSPIAWVMNGFQDLLFFGGTVTDILPEVAILLAIAGGLFVIGVW
ncbi:MAG: ABC transporter permease, partial [Chloroflexota bacterium]